MTDDDQAARAARARGRANWRGSVRHMAELPELEVIDMPAEVLLGLVTELTLEAWALAGKRLPSYTRAEMPGRVLRPGQR